MVRGKKATEALDILSMMPKKAAQVLRKVVRSASANAVHNADATLDDLTITTINVWRWTLLKRHRFVSRSGVHRYFKHRSFVRVVLE